jgi:hypothetical protein
VVASIDLGADAAESAPGVALVVAVLSVLPDFELPPHADITADMHRTIKTFFIS